MTNRVGKTISLGLTIVTVFGVVVLSATASVRAAKPLDDFTARLSLHVKRNSTSGPVGLSPATIKSVYNLTNAGDGTGTIAIVDAYDSPTIQGDLNIFSTQFGLPQCNTANPCFEKHQMTNHINVNSGWALEASLDVEWAHAIAPGAKVLLVEAKSASGSDLLNAVNYARNRADVVAVSMSWGSGEFSSEAINDSYFTSTRGAAFFASSGDSGTGAEWPAVSPNVIGVGGTSLSLAADGTLLSETAWSGSGGGVSRYESMPGYQTTYGVLGTNGKRAVPDVSYNADPASGVAVYDSTRYSGMSGWFQVGGTSAGAPQWAATKALGHNVYNNALYQDAKLSNAASFLRDITAGTNGACGVICTATGGYDTVTGLGSPLTTEF
ncbi:MAG TPA: S53 family peptidase [Patescibacteria group bacterium]|nr:S53 family peptidase [Patescibacteria group bacterium]